MYIIPLFFFFLKISFIEDFTCAYVNLMVYIIAVALACLYDGVIA